MELFTPALTRVLARLAVASVLLLICSMVALYGGLWGIGQAYPLLLPYHRAMVIVTILLAVLTFNYGLPRYFLLALTLINLVWLLGPLVTLGELSPLEAVLPRVLICAAIALLAVGYYIAALAEQVNGARSQHPFLLKFLSHPAPPRYPEVEQAVKKWRKILRNGQRQTPWIKRFFYQTGPQAPQACIVIIGPPNSGKTSALLNAELAWALPSQQQAAYQPFATTEHPQFWLAENALWCDTPGRFFDPEQSAVESADTLQALSKQLRLMKPEATLEAILFVIDCPRLLSLTPQQLTEYAGLCRTQLLGLAQQDDRPLPLYLLVSQLDQLVGFRDYFHDIAMEERYQLLGETFPQDRHESLVCLETLRQHLNSLARRIEQQVLTKQHHCEDIAIRKGIERFPTNVAALVRALLTFIEPLIAAQATGAAKHFPALQGVYLGCSQLCRESLYSHSQSLIRQWSAEFQGTESEMAAAEEGASLETLPRSFQHYFIKTLFQHRIVDEYRSRHALHAQHFITRLRRVALFTATGGIALLFLYAITQRYNSDKRWLTNSRQALHHLEETFTTTQPSLDSALTQFAELTPSTVLSQWGLGTPQRWAESADTVYNQWLIDHLWPRVVEVSVDELSTQLTKSDPQKLFTTLNIYLMLHGEVERDNALLESWFSAHPKVFAALARQESAALLLRRLFHQASWQVSAHPINQQLITSARQRLLQQPVAVYLYHDILQQLKDVSLPPIELAQLINSSDPLLFTSQAKVDPLAGLYTLQGAHYWDNQVATTHFPKAQARVEKILYGNQPLLRKQLLQHAWQPASLLYLTAYRRHWQEYIQGLRLSLAIAEPESKRGQQRQRIEYLLNNFTRPDSQLRQLLVNIAIQTQLATALDDEQPTHPTELAKNITEERQRRRDNVDHFFTALHHFVDAQGVNTSFSLEQLERALTQLYVALQATGITTDKQFAALVSEQLKLSEGSRILRYVDQLPQPLPRLIISLLSGAQQQVVQHTWTVNAEQIDQEILRYCRRHLLGRYPFASSGIEADPQSVAEMFSPQGKLARYFTEHLADKVDTHHHPWRFLTAEQAISPRLLTLFEQGKQLEQHLFPQGPQQLGLALTLAVQDMTSGITQLIIDNDDQQFRYVHGPILQQKLRWPATQPSARLQIRAVAAEGHLLWRVEEKGYWGMLRWLERSKKRFEPRGRQTVVTLGKGDAQARLGVNGLGVSVPHLITLFRSIDCSMAE